MSQGQPPLALTAQKRIDAYCDRFEADWKAGKRPRIEAYLGSASGPEKAALLRALLLLELELAGAGQAVDAAAYRARFPDQAAVVEAALASVLQRTTSQVMQASVETSVSRSGPAPAGQPGKPGAAPMPKLIGRFEVLERLGQGAFGQVFRGRDPQLDREVAIKVPLAGVLQSQDDRERFLREAKAAATIRHPNICPVYEVGQMGKLHFIVMALIEGQSLADYLRGRPEPLPVRQAVLVTRKLALALQAAHDRGIVHRDLKPANVLFDRERRDLMIMDFGLARRLDAGDIRQTREGTILGSPAYMSPEQARGDVDAVGPASDVYSLGVLLYEMLTGRLPFTGTVNEVLGKVLHVEPEPPSRLRPEVDAALSAICLRALAKDPGQRFGSMKDLAEALSLYLREASSAAEPAPPALTESAPPPAQVLAGLSAEYRAETEAAVEAALERSSRKTRRLALAVGGPLALLVGVLVVALVRQKPAAPGGNTYVDNSSSTAVTVILQNIPHLQDSGVQFLLDGKQIGADRLAGPLSIEVGRHELTVRKGEEVLEVRLFEVGAQDDQRPVVVPVPEPEGKVGQLAAFESKERHPLLGLAVTPDGRSLLAAGHSISFGSAANGWVYCWDLLTPKAEPRTFTFRGAARVAVDPRNNGQALFGATRPYDGSQAGYLQVWDLRRWRDLRVQPLAGCNSLWQLQYSPDGKRFLGCWANPSPWGAVWETETGKEVLQAPMHVGLCFAGDGKHIFLPGEKVTHELELRELSSKKTVRVYKGHSSEIVYTACSPDGTLVAAGTTSPAHAIRVWNVRSGVEVQAFIGHDNPVNAVAISRDKRWLLSGSWDATVRLWDIATGKPLQTFRHDGVVYDVCFSPGGRRALSCSADGTVRIWQLPR